MLCPCCGTESSSDFDYCPKCGKDIHVIKNRMAVGVAQDADLEYCPQSITTPEQSQQGELISAKENTAILSDPIKEAEDQVLVAFFGAIFLGVVNLGFRAFLYFKGLSASYGSLLFFADPLLILALGIILLKTKSRISAILLLLFYLASKIDLFLPLLSKELTPELQRSLISKLPSQLFYMAMFIYAFGNGIIGTFKFKKLTRKRL